MTVEKQMHKLSLSQKEIVLTEQICPGSAQNTISFRLYLPDYVPEKVKEAVDAVLDSADIFTASLCRGADGWMLLPGGEKISDCKIEEERFTDWVEEYMDISDRLPLDMECRLYQAKVIPLTEGGLFLYVRFHHLLIDGYGMSLFVQKVLDLLAGKKIVRSVFFTENNMGERENGFWNSYFADAEFEAAVFPQKATGMKFGSYRVGVPEDIMRQAGKFGEKEGISIPYLFASAYAFYLAKATDRKDAVFLMPRLNRTTGQMNNLGCYTLLVPVRVTVEETDTFAELCQKVKKASREASEHKDCGFDRILAALREEDRIGESISEYVFNFYRFVFETELRYSVRFSVAGGMSNHMTMNLFYNENGGLDIQADYQESIYTEETARYFCDAIFTIISQGMAKGGELSSGSSKTVSPKLSDIKAVGEEEYRKITSVSGQSFPVANELTIPSLFCRAVEKYKERPALYAGHDTLTFGQLDEISDRIACGIRRLGVESGDSVAFMLKRDYRLIPAILGISKAGAAFIPVDPAYPEGRITYIMENSRAARLISSADVDMAKNYDYIEINTLLSQEAEKDMLPAIEQDDLAYMIYTSGTTGRPKGVMLSHKGIANIVHPENNPFNRDIVKNCHGIVAIGSICFDISLFEIFVPLMNGLFVELGNEKSMVDAGELAAHISRHQADILHCTPSRITAYLSNQAFAEAFGNVKALLAAGEVLPGSLVKRLADAYPTRIYNGYGPTETTIGATITKAGDAVSIGRPIANMGIVLLSREKRAVPFGAAGEICIYGNGVGIGYKDRPEETEAKYILWNGIRLYRTGDLGYFTKDGRLMYCGRNDRQIKLRGLRMELSEIENVMGEFPGIAACCCMVRKMEKTDRLAGFYTALPGKKVDEEELKKYMKSRLTSYMVPDVLKELASMPQTPNGKTDVKALEEEPVTYVRVYRKPETEREKLICNVFEETLLVDKIGLDDNFFELGGNSFNAVALILKVEERLGLAQNQMEFGDLYRFPTPALLLEKIDKKAESKEEGGFDIRTLDYSGFEEYLAAHTEGQVSRRHLGNVLLTGVTGYLGIHILIDLLRHPELCGKIICLSRSKKTLTALKRVKSSLFYYAEEDFSEDYGKKWEVVEGDITNPGIFAEKCPVPIDTIINSAANVSHFSYGDRLEKINWEGVKNLIRFAQKENALLSQISTISVSGMTADNTKKDSFSEPDFYIGQGIYNKYIYSKYMAEYEMLRAAADDGLRIKIMRIGNLQGRISDGEFQMNLRSNAFARQLSSYVKLGAAPLSVYEGSVNFSPVDETAHNIVMLTATGENTAIFHVYPPAELKFSDLFQGLQKLGYFVDALPDGEFSELLQERKKTEDGREQMQGLMTNEFSKDRHEIPIRQEITGRYLQDLSEGWSTVTEEYLNKYLSALSGMDLF